MSHICKKNSRSRTTSKNLYTKRFKEQRLYIELKGKKNIESSKKKRKKKIKERWFCQVLISYEAINLRRKCE
jgi:hypothetical protein